MDVIVDEIKDSLRRVLEHESIHEFAQIWCDIGVEQKIRNDRIEKMVEYLCNLLTEMLEEEKRLKKTLEDSIESCSVELRQLEQLLKLSNQIESFSSNTIIDKERLIRERVDALNKIKHERMKRLKRLMEMETALCHSMGEKLTMSQKWQNTTSIPSEEDLQEYRNVVEQLESIKDQRQVEFRNMREKALLIWEELETTPTDDLGGKLYEGDVTRFTLSVENMTKISKYYTKLEKAASEQEGEAESLREKVISLWDRLEIPSEFREDYISNHQGYKSWVVSELKDELERLNIMKRNNLEKFVEATRVQLHDIWDKCFYGEEQRKEFHPAFTEEIDDDALSAHESELDRMRGFYADNSEIFKLIEKRESLWQRKIDMDMRLNDPGRLNNRGGKLLQEQRLHQKVNKDLPKVEKKLHAILEEWENDHCRHFIIKDQRYIDELETCWTNYNQTKEEEKVKRQQMKAETTMKEMKFGSKPQTPTAKRKAPAPTSNDRAAKVRKIGMSPLVKSITPKALARKGGPVKRNLRSKKENVTPSCGTTPASSRGPSRNVSGNDHSLFSAGSYADFQHGLLVGLETDTTARSSTLPRASTRLQHR